MDNLILRSVSCAILHLRADPQLSIVEANAHFHDTFARAPAHADESRRSAGDGGEKISALKDVFLPADFAALDRAARRALSEGLDAFEHEAEAAGRHGAFIPVLLKFSRDPAFGGFFCVMTDMGRSRKRLRRLREHIDNLETIINYSNVFPGKYHIPSKTMVFAEKTAALLGSELVYHNFPQSYVEQGLVSSDMERFVQIYHSLSSGEPVEKSTVQIRAADGEIRLLNRRMHITRDENGAPEYAFVFLSDVTEQREQKLAYEKWLHTSKSLKADSIHYYDYNLTTDVLESIDGNSPSIYPAQYERSFSGVAAYVADNIVHPDDRDEYLRVFSREYLLGAFARGEMEIHTAHRRLKPDGAYMKASGTIQLFADPFNGDVLCFVLIKNMDDALAQLKDETRTEILDSISRSVPGGMVFSYDSPGYPFYFVNEGMLEFLGYSRADLDKSTGGLLLDFIHPDDRNEVERILNSVLTSGGQAEMRHRVLKKNGSLGWAILRGRKVRDGDGRDFVLSIFVDVTEIVRLQEELRVYAGVLTEKNSQLEALTDNVPGGVCVMRMDPERTLIYANQTFYDMHGYTQEQAAAELDNKWVACVHPDDLDFSNRMIREARAKGEQRFEFERRAVKRDGSVIWILVCGSFMRADGEEYIYCVMLDVTARKSYEETKARHEQALKEAVEAAEEATRMKSEFLANMSHEIRTPMNGVLGLAELALDDPALSASTRDFVEKIRVSALNLLEIINAILDISKIEAGKMELENISFDLRDVFQECEAVSRVKAEEKGLELLFQADPRLEIRLAGDHTKLRQVLLNLLSNAIKFTNKGTVRLTAEVEEQGDHYARIRFEVKDSGMGMPNEQIRKIFDPFFSQADRSTSRRHEGTGLGLPISKRIIELMGGNLTVDSAPGRGSSFSFALSFKTTDAPAVKPENQESEKPMFSGEVLVFEDNLINQQVVREHLARVGLSCVLARNGLEGVEICRERAGGGGFDLILMDVHMPVMDGLDATRELQKMGVRAPIIALTANAMVSDREKYLAYGMSDYLTKPFRAAELWNCLRKHLPTVGRSAAGWAAGDEALLRRIKKDFIKDYSDVDVKIKDALEAGNRKEAHIAAHTLKSVAALIGASGLAALAARIEKELADGNTEDLRRLADMLAEELRAALAAMRAAEQAEGAQDCAPGDGPDSSALDRARVMELLDRLEPLLRRGDSASGDLVGEINRVITPALVEGAVLAGQVDDYDFDLALETAGRIREAARRS